jgi:hypothetical protein
MKNFTNKFKSALIAFFFAAPVAAIAGPTPSVSIRNGNFSSSDNYWNVNASPEINPENVYGGSSSSNYVTEIDQQASIRQKLSLAVNYRYSLSFDATRRTVGGTIANPGILVQVLGVQTNTVYASQKYNFSNTTWRYTTQSISFGVPANSTDKDFYIQMTAADNNTTLGVIVDNVALSVMSTLPVEYASLSASIQNNSAVIKWETATEINNNFFTVEASSDGLRFDSIGRVNSLGNEQGHSYSFNDNKSRTGVWYYRLVQTDVDGKRSISKVISLQFKADASAMNIFPTLATNNITIHVSAPKAGTTEVVIYDAAGHMVSHNSKSLNNGFNQFSVDITGLSKGTYFVQMLNNGLTTQKSVTIQKM